MVRRAQQSGQDPQEFANHMFEHNHIPELVAEIRRGKALAQIVESATVTDASGNVVDLKNLRPDGTLGDPAEAPRPGEADERTRRGARAGYRGRPSRARDARGPRLLDAAALLARWPTSWSCAPSATPTWPGPTGCTARCARPTRGASRVPRRSTAASPPGCTPGWARPAGDLRAVSGRSPSATSGPALEDTGRGRFLSRRQRADRRPAGPRAAAPGRAAGRTPRRARRPAAHRCPGGGVPAATGRVAVLLHGLSESESAFDRHRDRVGATYADTLAGLGWTPVLLRANTGLGAARERRRAGRPARTTWSTPGRSRSSGSRWSATRWAAWCCAPPARSPPTREQPWTALLTDVVTLGTPHLGAPLAGGVGAGRRALGRLPETAAFGRILDQRSVGRPRPRRAASATRCRRCRTRATTWSRPRSTRSPRHPVGLGRSATCWCASPRRTAYRRRREPRAVPGRRPCCTCPRAGHFDLLNHPQVHAALRGGWRTGLATPNLLSANSGPITRGSVGRSG